MTIRLLLILLVIEYSATAWSQTDIFPGIWQMKIAGVPPVEMELKIGSPEKNTLYPASITIKSGTFYGVYQLLLVKKNAWQLAISKNKYAAEERPFHLDMLPLNGSFELRRNINEQPSFTIIRLPLKQSSRIVTDSAALVLQNIISSGSLKFTRIISKPWKDAFTDKILNPSSSPVYFGLVDTAYVSTRYGNFSTYTLNKTELASAVLNGRSMFEQWQLTKKERRDEIMIEPGSNVLAFFADYSINITTGKANLHCEFDKVNFNLNFNNPNDSGASFIAAKVILLKDMKKINSFQPYSYPRPGEPPLLENEKLLGSITSKARQITLAVWDDAVEDGDTISISINNKIITQNLLIKKRPQFIHVTLSPGSNSILFVGENLGSIPPNTAVLEIIDGKNRKAFFLETLPGENNLLKIFYEYSSQ